MAITRYGLTGPMTAYQPFQPKEAAVVVVVPGDVVTTANAYFARVVTTKDGER